MAEIEGHVDVSHGTAYMIDTNKLLGELLTKLERREAALIEWGFFDVVHTAEELIELFSNDAEWGTAFLDLAAGSEELFVDNLAECRLLYRVDDSYPRRYRSRFAESVRLMARLRQRFKADDWLRAPELVSQVRLHMAPRRFPVRDQTVDQVWKSVAPSSWSQSLQRRVLTALLTAGKPLSLAAFQVRAINRILGYYRGAADPSGTVVTAGTGGGKTKAFYIPALMGIAADVAHDPAPATRVLALYPRNVLLSDQFAEAAAQASIVNGHGLLKRPISVGALIGDVPFNADFERDQRNRWALASWQSARSQKGALLPHIRHPETGERLVWTDADRQAGSTALRRDTSAGEIVFPDGVLCLTREHLVKRPPDIFLTSVEMLNKELSGEIGRAVLAFAGRASTLRMVLLDEIHTYEGLTGAQVPWILRRLSFWLRPARRDRQMHYVGLSATLQDAADHLAVLTGVQATRIEEIAPRTDASEISIEGQEYNVVLKSHPGGGAGVLSTSIQAAMLGARVLTPAGARAEPNAVANPSYFFGRKVFGFTDNLDVVNRWLPDLKNAEQTLRLASLRAPQTGDALRDAAGQVWRLPALLGHNLQARLSVDRISSQDPGIDARADIVVATSSLEVGYDDPEVGMVLQHKAPRSAASFLQRKGRAGRRAGMRPWTVVVLTDHGRDRWAFRDSEQLFNPVLKRLSLPAFNPYLLRIQATWFLVDWIASKIGGGVPNLYLTRFNHRRPDVEGLVNRLLSGPGARQEFTKAMEAWLTGRNGGFRVPDAESLARRLLWTPPRAVLRHVVPELRKFMAAGYRSSSKKARLLPRFLPATTWDVLDSQDVELHLDADQSEFLDASKVLYEAVPGRVSRRFVVNPNLPSKWLQFSAQLLASNPPSAVPIHDICESWLRNDELTDVAIFQPTAMVLDNVPTKVKNSSNAQWEWELRVRRVGEGGYFGVHTSGVLAMLFESSTTWLHRDQAPLHVYRFASSCRYEIQLDKSQVQRGTLDVTFPSSEVSSSVAAIGFSRSVDALQLRFHEALIDAIPSLPDPVRQELRTAYFRFLAIKSDALRERASSFAIGNLCTSAIGMVVATALQTRIGLEQAWDAIPDKAKAAAKVMRSILSVDSDGHDADNRRLTELADLWRSPDVLAEVNRLVSVLWAPLGEQFDRWLRDRFVETLRAAIEEAIQAVLPEASDGALRVEAITEEDETSILILESDPGGVGIVERLVLAVTNEPDQFGRAVEWALTTCPSEESRSTILSTIRAARDKHSEMRGVFSDIRGASDYRTLHAAQQALVDAMGRHDLPTGKRHVTSLLSKALGPGTSQETERWLSILARARHRMAARIGIMIDSRSFAYWLQSQPGARARMASTLRQIIKAEPDDDQIYQAFLRLTLEPCSDSCAECLGTDKDALGLAPSRRLASLWLGAEKMLLIEVDDGEAWVARLREALRSHSRIRLQHRSDLRTLVASTLAVTMTSEFDQGYHSSPMRITSVRRNGSAWQTDVEVDLWEAS